jgi:hypothetical protein
VAQKNVKLMGGLHPQKCIFTLFFLIQTNVQTLFKPSRSIELKSNLKRQENMEDLTKISNKANDTSDLDTSKKNMKSGKNSVKTIGFSFKNSEDTNQYISETNEFYQSDTNDAQLVAGDDCQDEDIELVEEYDLDQDVVQSNKNIQEMLKITETLSFNDNFTEYTDGNYKVHASINQYKMKFLGSMNGMNEFKSFLKGTAGYKLLKFWLDCEFYRDSMQDYDQIENMATRNRLFRYSVKR